MPEFERISVINAEQRGHFVTCLRVLASSVPAANASSCFHDGQSSEGAFHDASGDVWSSERLVSSGWFGMFATTRFLLPFVDVVRFLQAFDDFSKAFEHSVFDHVHLIDADAAFLGDCLFRNASQLH